MILLDTHAVVWWLGSSEWLSVAAGQEIAQADRILVSPVSCWEVALLVRLARIELDQDPISWTRTLFATDRVEPANLTPTAAAAAGMLGREFPGDPIDRMLYATARERSVPFVTRDKKMRSFARAEGEVKTIW